MTAALYMIGCTVIIGLIVSNFIKYVSCCKRVNRCVKKIPVYGKWSFYGLLYIPAIFGGLDHLSVLFSYLDTNYMSQYITYNIAVVFYALLFAHATLYFTLFRKGFATEKGVYCINGFYPSHGARFTFAENGDGVNLKIKNNSGEIVKSFLISESTRRFICQYCNVDSDNFEYCGKSFLKRNLFLSCLCSVTLTAVLAVWYTAEMPVVFVGDNIIDRYSDNVFFSHMPVYVGATQEIEQLFYDNGNIQTISDYDSGLFSSANLSMLKYMPNLKYYSSPYFSQKYDYSELGNLSQLEGVFILNGEISDFKWMSKLTKLKYLYDYSGRNFDFDDIKNMDSLTHLGIMDTQVDINEIELLRDSCNLKCLALLSCKIENSTSLGELGELVYLNLKESDVGDFSFLSKLNNLTELSITDVKNAENYSAIAYCCNLTELYISGTDITDISFLKALDKLETFSAQNVAAEDWTILYELPSLKNVYSYGTIPQEIKLQLEERGVKVYD